MHITQHALSSLPRSAWHKTASTGYTYRGGRAGDPGRAGQGTKHMGNTSGPVAWWDRVGCIRGASQETGGHREACRNWSPTKGDPEAHLKQQIDTVKTLF